jgi:septum formation protein
MSDFLQQQSLILASSSTIRAKLLNSLGLKFLVVPSYCDESQIKERYQSESVFDLGLTLATTKALEISTKYPDYFVIAADQLCVIDNKILDKPLNHSTAIKQLGLLSGRTHQQIACVCIAKENQIVWSYHESASLTLHQLSEQNIEAYLNYDKPYQSCGSYQYESKGKWLFRDVHGKEDTILGLPLIPLTNALLNLGIVGWALDQR